MRRLLLVIAALAGSVTACGYEDPTDAGSLTIVTSVYPVAYAVARVVGEHVNLHNLTPAGVEPHDVELTSDEIDRIDDAELVFYVGAEFQPAVADAARRRGDKAVDVARGLLVDGDPHFWLDPTVMARAVDRIEAAVKEADPKGEANWDGGAAFKRDLADLDAEFETTLSQCQRKDIVTAHASFGYLARRYGLTQHAISGIDPESEPDPQRLADLSSLIQRRGVTTVFFEELVPRDFADTLARETGAKTAMLNPLEGLTEAQLDAHEDYFTVMRANLAALTEALDCPPPPPRA